MCAWHVAFEGPIAAGKTTIAGLFGAVSGARVLLEDFSGNDFLEDFYANHDRWALPMQLTFLLARHRQFSSMVEPNMPTVADHTYAKDAMFARLLLRDRELRLYEGVHRTLLLSAASPGVVVYLDAPNDVLLDRIRVRNRPYESAITTSYLSRVRDAYRRELLVRSDIPILSVDTGVLDLESKHEMDNLYRRILDSIPT